MAAVVGILRVLLQGDSAQLQSELEKTDRSAKRTLQGIQRLANDFSGQRLVNEAAKVTVAVNQIGGASKLTQTELARVGSVVEAAVSKLRVLGQTVPPEIAKLSAEIRHLNEAARQSKELDALKSRIGGVGAAADVAGAGGLSRLTGALGAVGIALPALGVAGAVTGVVRLASAAFESAGRITDLSQKLGVSTDAIQEMQAVANQTGSTVEAFAQAAFKLGVNVASGSDKAKAAIKDLGLEYEHLKSIRPEDMHREVIRALEQVHDANERNRLGVALYGKTFSEIAPSIASGYSQIADSARKSGADQIKALDDAADAWQQFKDDVNASVVSVLGNMVRLSGMARGGFKQFTEQQRQEIATRLGAGEDITGLLREFETANRQAAAAAQQTSAATTQATAAATDYTRELAAARAEVAGLSRDQKTQLNAALQLGGDAAQKYADRINLSDAALRLYSSSIKGGTKDTDGFARAQDALFGRDLIQRANDYVGQLGGVANLTKVSEEKKKELKRAVDAAIEAYARLGQVAPQALRDISAATTPLLVNTQKLSFVPLKDGVEDVGAALHDLASGPIAETGAATTAADKAAEEWARTNGAVLAPSIMAVGSSLDEAEEKARSFGDGVRSAFRDLPNVIMGALQGGGDLGKSIGALFGKEIFAEDSALVQSLTGGLTKVLGKTVGGAISAMIPGLGTLLGAGIGALTDKLFGKLFGAEGRKVNDLRDSFTATAGGIQALQQKAEAAGISLRRFYDAKTVKQYQAAVDELTAAFSRLDQRRAAASDLFEQIMDAGQNGIPAALRPAIEQLIQLGLLTDEQVAKLTKLGDGSVINVDQLESDLDSIHGRLESLGPAFQQAKIDQTADKYINSIQRMIDAGGDVGGILFDAQEEISALVQESLKFGTTLPANMKPWIEELARAGLLVDANGQKLTDLANLKWGDAIETEAEKQQKVWDEILEAIKALVAEIRGPLLGAINSIPDEKRIKVGVDYEDGGRPDRGSDEGFATGTMGRFGDYFANFGKGFPTILHGSEAVVTPAQAIPFAMRVLDSMAAKMPSLSFNAPLAAAGLSQALATAGPSSTTTTSNFAAVLMPMPAQGLSAYEAAREATRYLAESGLATDAFKVSSQLEKLFAQWYRTYGGRR